MNPITISISVILFIAAVIVFSYNRFISQKNIIRDSWATVDTELRRRYDLIPNLVESVKGYAAHERALFEHVATARAAAVAQQGSPEERVKVEAPFVDAIRQVFAVVENYPQLKTSPGFLELQRELADTEDRIQAARRSFNDTVRDYNRRVQSVPSNLIAAMFGFREAEYFEVDETIRSSGAPAAGLSG